MQILMMALYEWITNVYVWLELDYQIINSKVTTEGNSPTAVLTSQAIRGKNYTQRITRL